MSGDIRGSGVATYLQCPAYGAWKHLPEAEGRPVHCGTLCGTMAHSKVTGQKLEMPKIVTWDGDTQSVKDLEWQAESIAKGVKEFLGGAKVLHRELEVEADGVTGHIDLVIETHNKVQLVDLKTGHRKPGSSTWTQLAAYAWMYNMWWKFNGGREADDVVLLWVPRVRRGEYQPVYYDTRKAEPLAEMGSDLLQRATENMLYPEVRIPGEHCRYCGVEYCLMRETNLMDMKDG